MNLDQLLDYALAKPDVEESLPFGPDVLVLKTNGKMFLLIPLETDPLRFNAKCDPEWAEQLREEYTGIQPGYHMNKKYWNTILLDGSVPTTLARKLIDHSYDLIHAASKKSK